MAKLVLPRVHVIVLCDLVEEHPDEEGVFNLLGARARISAASFPHSPGQLCAYLQVTGHAGTVDLELAVVQASTDEEAIRMPPFAVQCSARLLSFRWLVSRSRDILSSGVFRAKTVGRAAG